MPKHSIAQKTVIVLGMHRSGNSLVGGILHILGVDLGKQLKGGSQFNPKGHFEDLDFQQLNEKILKHGNGGWDNPPDRTVILSSTMFSSEIERLTSGRSGLWGWRDPRTTLTIELYLPHLVNPHFIICWRNPYEIAKSLKEMVNFDELKALRLTNVYNQNIVDLIADHPNLPRLMVAFEDVTANPVTEARRLAQFLQVEVADEQVKQIKEFTLSKDEIRQERQRVQREREIQLEQMIGTLQNQLTGVSAELEKIYNSLSWKMTAWLRRAKAHFAPARPSAVRRDDQSFLHLEPAVSKVVSPKDRLYTLYRIQHCAEDYFKSGLSQLDTIDALLKKYGKKKLTDCQSVADYACHYGRLLRAFRASLPQATLYACDIDQEALTFCAREFGCIPRHVDWHSVESGLDEEVDLLTCISLVTHTRYDFFSRVLTVWERMLKPGGLLFFTYLGERYLDEWIAGRMGYHALAHQGPPITEEQRQRTAAEFRQLGHGFCGFRTSYSTTDEYGVGFMSKKVVVNEVAQHPALEFLVSIPGFDNNFGQDLAIVRKLPK